MFVLYISWAVQDIKHLAYEIPLRTFSWYYYMNDICFRCVSSFIEVTEWNLLLTILQRYIYAVILGKIKDFSYSERDRAVRFSFIILPMCVCVCVC
jgi:hypothetical protein